MNRTALVAILRFRVRFKSFVGLAYLDNGVREFENGIDWAQGGNSGNESEVAAACQQKSGM